MSEQQGRNLKVVLLGDTGVGKTSLINRYIKNEFDPDSPSTIAGSFISKTFKFPEYDNILQMEVNTIHNTKQIWDTAGQEQYRALTKLYYQNADAIILVYDITRSQSFEEVKTYYKSLSETVDVTRVHFVVVGNKSDLYEQEQVPKEIAQQYAKEINGMFKLTSCLNATGINVIS